MKNLYLFICECFLIACLLIANYYAVIFCFEVLLLRDLDMFMAVMVALIITIVFYVYLLDVLKTQLD